MNKIVLTGYLDVAAAQWDAVMAALPAHVAATRAEPGCLHFSVAPDRDVPLRLLVDEAFTNRAAFEAHRARSAESAWAQVSAGIARHYEISEG